jgi:hypothetical protein
MTASLFEFRDLDLMLKLQDEADEDGWTTTEHLARSLGLPDDLGAVGRRLAWMRRYGMVSFDEQRRMWQLTPGGDRVTHSRLKAAQARTLETLDETAMIEVMAHVTTTYRLGDPMVAHMLRREFRYGTQPGLRRNGRRR